MGVITMISAIVFCLVLGILVSFHEFGHLIVAKLCGMKIDAYSIGFGPKLIKFKLGETEYSLSLIQLGGYIKPAGPNFKEDVRRKDPNKNRYFVCKPAWKKALVIIAGPIFNLLLGLILTTGLIYYTGTVPEITTTIGEILENSPASKAGIQKNDSIVAINGKNITNWLDVLFYKQKNTDQKILLTLKRNGNILNVSIKPESTKEGVVIGIAPKIQEKKVTGLAIPIEGWKRFTMITKLQIDGMLDLFTGKISPKNVGGPISIFKITDSATKEGFSMLVGLMILLNIALGLFNLLPIPALDGGQLQLLILEMIMHRPLSKKIQSSIQIAGFIILLLILLLATINDVSRLIHH
ncbi:MAG: RIP metalloprotease RseP [Minisyncoccota bacterium]